MPKKRYIMLAAAMGLAVITTVQANKTRMVDVRFPDGNVVRIADSTDQPWWKSEQVSTYGRYYYDDISNVYVVYGPTSRSYSYYDNWRGNTWCPPGQHRNGRC